MRATLSLAVTLAIEGAAAADSLPAAEAARVHNVGEGGGSWRHCHIYCDSFRASADSANSADSEVQQLSLTETDRLKEMPIRGRAALARLPATVEAAVMVELLAPSVCPPARSIARQSICPSSRSVDWLPGWLLSTCSSNADLVPQAYESQACANATYGLRLSL